MKTFIIPTDFSETAKNAALYGAKIAAQVQDATVILYNVFEEMTLGIDSSPLADETAARKKIRELALENVKKEMQESAGSFEISYVAEQSNSFVDSLESFAQDQRADLIIIGITGTSPVEQMLVGSNTLKIVEKNICPVMIVPRHATFKGIKNVLFTTDFKEDASTTIHSIQSILDLFEPTLHVVNVSNGKLAESHEHTQERTRAGAMLEKYSPEFHFIVQSDFVDAINQFVVDKNIDLILTVPRKHSFVDKFFKLGHTKQLAYHSHVPVIAIHE